ncbi:MAG TPA: TonB-dependent receptor [Candidatus Polarisedimenticolaceae bacterium]|nr:TonB-dependent receptor [Candidatus Polarisedimenticolaceae bacterium]
MRLTHAVRLAAVACLLFAMHAGAFAQSKTTSAITGMVRGQDGGAIIGAAVTIESPQLIGGARSTATDAKGGFRFPEIAPGMYTVTVVMAGYKTLKREDVRIQVGGTLDLHLDLTPFAGQETVTVTGEPPNIDVTSPETKSILSNEVLANIPASQFQPDALNLAPGINNTVAYGGASDTGVAWNIDGVDTSDPEAGSAWSFVNFNIIDQVELAGLGAPAEYGGFTGVMFNSTTKSGSNLFHGLVDAYYTDDNLAWSNNAPAGANPTEAKYLNTTANFGGPFVKDKLWWYISGQYFNEVTNNGGPDITTKSPRGFGKISWQINANNNFDAWVEWDYYDVKNRGGDLITPEEATVHETAPEWVWNVAWKSVLTNNTILDVTFQGYEGYYYLDPTVGYGQPGLYDGITGLYSQNSYYWYKADRGRNQINASISQHVADWGGTHDFKFGMEVERSTLRSRYGYPTGQWIYNNYYGTDPGTGVGGYGTAHYYGAAYDVKATNERVSGFAQDDWQITPRLTINPGVRLDYYQGRVPTLGKVYAYMGIAPRLGLAWNITGDNQNLLKFHAGRYYAGLHATYYYWVDPGAFQDSQKVIDWDSGAVQTFPVRTKTYAIDPNLKQPYMDQVVLGYDRGLPMGMVFSVTGIYRTWKQFVETIAQHPNYTPVTGHVGVQDAAGNFVSTGQTVTMYDWNNFDTDTLLVTNPSGLTRTFKGAMFTLTKNFKKNWQGQISYVYSKTTGTTDNVGFDGASDSGGQDAGPSPFLDTPNSKINWNGHLTHDPTNQIKIQGTYAFERPHLWLSGNWTYYTGDTYTKKSQCLLVDDDNNPATPDVCHAFPQDGIAKVRYFAEPRGDRRLPGFNELDLRLEWKPPLGKKGNLGVIADVFNVLNYTQIQSVQDRDNGSFGEPLTYNVGRYARFGIRYEF